MRLVAMCMVLAACGRPELARPRDAPVTDPRLSSEVTPRAYDLTLELDPLEDAFTGHVAIELEVAQPTRTLWLHAVELEIQSARIGDQVARVIDAPARAIGPGAAVDARDPMRGFALAREVSGRVVLTIDYRGRARDQTGNASKGVEGLFRQRNHREWYLYSQAESVFARRILPCFDEPRWKPRWKVAVIVPPDQVALGNGAAIEDRVLPDGRHQVRFAEVARLPSYLFAIAVGPFDVIDAGKLGRAAVPARIVVPRGDGARLAHGIANLGAIVDELEGYLDAPLPVGKLDLVAVPDFFGAMENPGLITFARGVLVGGRQRTMILAHELAHLWFGDSVTPVWWEHLWLSEGFASWLGVRVAAELGEIDSPLAMHASRAYAYELDDLVDAKALVHPIARSGDVEPAFDTLVYQKASAIIELVEAVVGAEPFRDVLRRYLAKHAGTSVTTQALLDALAAGARREVADALASNLGHAGIPVVELAVACHGAPRVVASVRDGVTLPMCVRYPVGDALAQACFLAGARTEQPLKACPTWLAGNADGRGYYRIAGRDPARGAPVSMLSSAERLTRGADAALAVRHGELRFADALAEIRTLAAPRDAYGELAALAIARAIEPALPDDARPAWAAWLARLFAHRLTAQALASTDRSDGAVRGDVLDLARGPVIASERAALRGLLARDPSLRVEMIARVDAATDRDALFARQLPLATKRDEVAEMLGAFPAAYAERVVAQLIATPSDGLGRAVEAMLDRGESRAATWRALHARIAEVRRARAEHWPALITALGGLCDAQARAQLDDDFAAPIAALTDVDDRRTAQRALERARAMIDRCVARRPAAHELALLGAPSTPAR